MIASITYTVMVFGIIFMLFFLVKAVATDFSEDEEIFLHLFFLCLLITIGSIILLVLNAIWGWFPF